ncbi:hypothetical protein AVT42_gp03 [Polaribacter phage P12002S]|uniref:Uncharacterized protein n=1 Tax=Polaribacter phage P12002S TaxID=1647387 RepID=A0A0F7ILI0_9CAUD|nr:hypothetical protein AVT42_gp03 [Polaribacter phage P12002S]AKG94259.1 hypothetical protein P12002S_0003 [Polaribacter phage P12002S]
MLDNFKGILKENGLNGKSFCNMLLGMSYGSYRIATRKGAKVVPKWVRSFVIGYELGKLSKD